MKLVEVRGRRLVLANTGREIVAFAQNCPHASSPLDRGRLRRRSLICPQHGYIWDVCTGEPLEPADEDILPRYAVQIDRQRQRVLVALIPPSGS
jgi:nitrite reductase/ring-hydroxylating ferredoxin subunit